MPMSDSRPDRRLLAACWTWAGDAGPGGPESSPVPWQQRIAAVAASGWDGVGLSHTDVVDYGDTPGLSVLRARLEDAGIHRIELEFLDGWWTAGPEKTAADQVRDELLNAAAILGADVIKAGAPAAVVGCGPALLTPLIDAFGELADRAGEFGVNIALEAMSHTVLPAFPDAAQFIRAVAHPRAGLAVDVFQLAKSGDDDWERLPAQLDGVPVFMVEVGDARIDPAYPRDHGIRTRCLPGRGDIDLPGFINAIRATGWTGHWGVEIISDELRALDLEDGLRIVRRGVDEALDTADDLARRRRT